jgi:hypothetical protein
MFGSRRISKQILQHWLNRRSPVQGVGAMTSAEDGSWSSTAGGQDACDRFNRRFMLFRVKACNG